jgi:polyhydroxybutyrate depolymerase
MTTTGRRVFVAPAALVAVTMLAACSSGGSDAHASRRSDASGASTTSTTVGPRPSAGCARHTAVAHGITDHTLGSGGVERAYQVDVPDSYDGTRPYAVLLGLHALTVDYKFIPSMVGFDQGDRYHFIGVNPSGRLDDGTPFWNAAPARDNYDVAFIADLLDELAATFCIDTTRVYSTGMSNGAQMSSLLGCRLSDRIAGIAPVAGEEYLEPCRGRPVPIIAFHGTADPILPYKGGGLNATTIADDHFYKGHPPAGLPAPLRIDDSMARWARHNGCDPEPVETRVAPHVLRRAWSHCRAATVLYVIEGGGHAWPGKPFPQFEKTFGAGTKEVDATALMFRFFFDRRAD